MSDDLGVSAVSPGRINNAVRALEVWYRAVAGREPGYNDRLVFDGHAQAVLIADDKYLVGQTKVAANVDKLRVHLAKALAKIEELKLAGKAQRTRIRSRAEAINRREKLAEEKLARAEELERQAKAWKLADESHVRQLNIARDQLVANNIEPDRRIM
jgi:hypothetical protein